MLDSGAALRLNRAMCGRFTLTASPGEVAELLALGGIEAFPPRYNIAPTQPILVVLGGERERPGGNASGRTAMLVRWGLVPAWVKDLKGFPLLFNARSETASEKSAFRAAMRYRRCLVPASGFYEWRRRGKERVEPYFLRPSTDEPFAFAGLMETSHAPDGGEIDTAAILTTAANRTLQTIHERMPVVIRRQDHGRWLDCRENDPASVAGLLASASEDFFEAVPVSDKINRTANFGPEVQERVARNDAPDASPQEPAGPAQPRLL